MKASDVTAKAKEDKILRNEIETNRKKYKESLEKRLEKVADTPREAEFKLQVEKVDALIEHLKKELEEEQFF